MSSFLEIYNSGHINSLVNVRPGEIKLGEQVQVITGDDWQQELLYQSDARYVLLGIPEDIGVRANGGIGGADTAWMPALKAFLNIQSTSLLRGDEVLVLGHFNFDTWMRESADMDTAALRELTGKIDESVAPVIRAITAAGKIPLVVGGGHNNAYPLLKGAAKGWGSPLSCINLDAHSDFRLMEGRHSGNGFRYAQANGYLQRYAIIGLHENYNSEAILEELHKNELIHFSTYDALFVREEHSFHHAIGAAIQHTAAAPLGIELDLDSIAGTLSSAATPCGISVLQARHYVYTCGALPQLAYLHLAEGAVTLRDRRQDINTAKLIAYLLSDFIKGGKQSS